MRIKHSPVLNSVVAYVLLQLIPVSAVQAQPTSPALTAPIFEFTIEDASMDTFLRRFSSSTGISYGFIWASQEDDSNHAMITIDAKSISAGELLDEACRQEPRYGWAEAGENKIIMLPVDDLADPAWLGNQLVGPVSVDGTSLREAVFVLMEIAMDSIGVGMGYGGSDWGGGLGGRSLGDRPVSFTLPEGATYLDLMNAIFDSAGSDVTWGLYRGNPL